MQEGSVHTSSSMLRDHEDTRGSQHISGAGTSSGHHVEMPYTLPYPQSLSSSQPVPGRASYGVPQPSMMPSHAGRFSTYSSAPLPYNSPPSAGQAWLAHAHPMHTSHHYSSWQPTVPIALEEGGYLPNRHSLWPSDPSRSAAGAVSSNDTFEALSSYYRQYMDWKANGGAHAHRQWVEGSRQRAKTPAPIQPRPKGGKPGATAEGREGVLPGEGREGVLPGEGPMSDFHHSADIDDDEEDTIDIYHPYNPSKLQLPVEKPHPGKIVETASLAAVQSPDVSYTCKIISHGLEGKELPGVSKKLCQAASTAAAALSAAQLECIVYASQIHDATEHLPQRRGFFLGDGAGVGKGRQIAGLILENFLHKRTRAIWVSVSTDLIEDAARDLRDVGLGHIEPYPLHKHPYTKKLRDIEPEPNVVFCTYSALVAKAQRRRKSRLSQLVQWLGPSFDGMLVFDECHKAKNMVSDAGNAAAATKTGKAVLEIQSQLPKARVIYCSATGASEVRHLGYMSRLGLWDLPHEEAEKEPGAAVNEAVREYRAPFRSFTDFVKVLKSCGVGGMELVAMELKRQGIFLSRHLSFLDATFRTERVALTAEFATLYREASAVWDEIYNFGLACRDATDAALLTNIQLQSVALCDSTAYSASSDYDSEEGVGVVDTGSFVLRYWGAHQRFFRYLCIASKVNEVVSLSKKALGEGKCVVIGLQSTGESHISAGEGEEHDLSSSPPVPPSPSSSRSVPSDCSRHRPSLSSESSSEEDARKANSADVSLSA